METHVNPDCGHLCEETEQLVYAKSELSGLSLHYIWSSIREDRPVFLVTQSDDPRDKVSIDWPELLNGSNKSISTQKQPVNHIGIMLKDVIFWNDTQKAADFNESEPHVLKDFKDLNQTQEEVLTVNTSSSASAKFEFRDYLSNVTITVTVSAGIESSRYQHIPHLMLTPKSFHVETTITGDPEVVNFTSCRVLLDFVVFHRNGDVDVTTTTTIDDEFSPGVFSIKTATAPTDPHSFMQWKPVAYNRADRIIAHTIDTNVSLNTSTDEMDSRVMRGFCSGSVHCQTTNLRAFFGAAKDTFYTDSEFTSFSFVVGLGQPDADGLSLLVQLIIWIGFGVPFLALVVGASYLAFKRIRRRSSQFLIQND